MKKRFLALLLIPMLLAGCANNVEEVDNGTYETVESSRSSGHKRRRL